MIVSKTGKLRKADWWELWSEPRKSEQHISWAHGALGSWIDQPGIWTQGLCAGEARGLGMRVLVQAGLNDLANVSWPLWALVSSSVQRQNRVKRSFCFNASRDYEPNQVLLPFPIWML